MTLYSARVHRNDFVESVEGHIPTRAMNKVELLTDGDRYRMLLSRLLRNLPRMLMAMTRRPLSASISRTVRTVS